ncbi:MAG: aldo/keto reductase [Pikeienuella sp.]
MKLALGTVQFGIDYGAFNASGQTPLSEVRAVLARAKSAGITVLDTARAYGAAEDVLAQAAAPAQFDIITKCPDLSREADPVAALGAAFETSCRTLGVSQVYGYLLHNSADLMRSGVWDALEALVQEGRVSRIGVSGYDVAEVGALCERFPITLTQLPANVLAPWFEAVTLPETVELHVRSAFLQGFLLSDPAHLPTHFQPWRATLEGFRAQAAAQDLTPLQAALAPLLTSPQISRVVLGVENLAQLDEILQATKIAARRSDVTIGPFPDVTADLTDPRRWNRTK